MGSTQLQILSKLDGIKISVIVEQNRVNAEEAIKKAGLGDTPITDNFEMAIEKFPIDIVWIVSPNSLHAHQAIFAMERGINVFCEKPASTTFSDYEKEIELSKANPKVMSMVDYILNFNPMEQVLSEMVKADEFGRIDQLQINYRHPVNIQGDKVWKLKKAFMGDAMGMGINHAISMIVRIMQIQAKPLAVYATSFNSKVRGFEPDPVWNIMIRYDNGATAICLGNIDVENGYDLYHCLAGSKGGFIFDSRLAVQDKIRLWGEKMTNGQWVYPLHPGFESTNALVQKITPDIMLPDSGDVLDHQIKIALEHFINSVRTGVKSPLSFDNSSLVAEIGWAAQVSAREHREVLLPMSSEDCAIARLL
ncbi:MAG: Gfo/Idh/MocA family oxidoreductase [Candidatus Cloacimonetes bacterium]|nr:Gfo/Idh/MocA family oxidoreductase [Candidatus Cloacimonadota bacterium]